MATSDQAEEQAVRELADFLWEREGRPEGRAYIHWHRALAIRSGQRQSPDDDGLVKDAKAVLEGDPCADFPALLTKDVPGG
jgi:hypothetical protein